MGFCPGRRLVVPIRSIKDLPKTFWKLFADSKSSTLTPPIIIRRLEYGLPKNKAFILLLKFAFNVSGASHLSPIAQPEPPVGSSSIFFNQPFRILDPKPLANFSYNQSL